MMTYLGFFEPAIVRKWFGMEVIMADTCHVCIKPGCVPHSELMFRKLPFCESTVSPRVHPARWRRGCLRSTTMMRGAEAEPTNANDLMTFLPGRASLSNSVRT